MPPTWKGGPGRDWPTYECRNCRWLWLDAVPRDIPELRDIVSWAAGSPFGANRLDVWHKQLHLLLPCSRLQQEKPAKCFVLVPRRADCSISTACAPSSTNCRLHSSSRRRTAENNCITSLAGWDREAGMAVTHNVDNAIVDKTGVAGVDIVMHYAEERLRL